MEKKKILVFGIVTIAIVTLGTIIPLSILHYFPNSKDPFDPPDSPGEVTAKGDRLLGIQISERADHDFEAGFQEAQSAGIDFITLTQQWDDIETSPGVYYNGETNHILKIANDYYSFYGVKVALIINPIDTVKLDIPSDLEGTPLNNSQVITRYNNLADWIFSQIPNLNLISFSIGNEIDIYLEDDSQKWDEFTDFFNQTYQHIKSLDSNLKVGTKATFHGLIEGISKTKLQTINQISDIVLLTYYPFSSGFKVKDPNYVISDFDSLVEIYPSEEIQFLEAGCPSSLELNSSENRQGQFIHLIFKAWDIYETQITTINILWLYDISQETLDYYKDYYSYSDSDFLEYLGTLGIIYEDYSPKVAFTTLKAEGSVRGW
jgi:hypothetical protein